jgi:hypothetical protein
MAPDADKETQWLVRWYVGRAWRSSAMLKTEAEARELYANFQPQFQPELWQCNLRRVKP